MKILYLGSNAGNSKLRAHALRRSGHDLFQVDPVGFLPKFPLTHKWILETGALFLERYISDQIIHKVQGQDFDIVVVNGGELLGPEIINKLKNRYGYIVNYNNDNPFVDRDKSKWRLYLKAIPYYDLLVVLRESNVGAAYQYGAKNVLRVFMSADEIIHAPRTLSNREQEHWSTEVGFIGCWFPERGPFMKRLIQLGLPLCIDGDRWNKAPEWNFIKDHWRGGAIWGNDYSKAIQCAKISLGLLSKGNQDLHTRRSVEIPAIGSLLCAERTSEHRALYREGEEAVFWSSPEECARLCFELLEDDERRKKIAKNGRERCLRNGFFNQAVMERILNTVFEIKEYQKPRRPLPREIYSI